MAETSQPKKRIQISKESLLKSFVPVDEIPAMMVKEMQDIQPLTHLLSKYVIRPIAFDANPYILPKSAQFVKYGGKNAYHKKMAAQEKYKAAQSSETQIQFRKLSSKLSGQVENFDDDEDDDFETVAEKPKKIVRAGTKPETPKGPTFEKKGSRKTSDVDSEPITRSQRKTSDAAETAQAEVQPAKVTSPEPVKEEKVEEEKVAQEETKEKPVEAQSQQPQNQASSGKKNKKKKKKEAEPEEQITVDELAELLKPLPKTPPEEKSPSESDEELKQTQASKNSTQQRKGPKPRGMAKFKQVKMEEVQIDENELSANQKRKLEERRLKQEQEEKAAKEEAEKKRLAREKIEEEERARKNKEIFEGLAAAKQAQKNEQKQSASNFADIMNEQAFDSKKKREEEARYKKIVKKEEGLTFNYLDGGHKAVGKETLAAASVPSSAFTKPKNKGKKK